MRTIESVTLYYKNGKSDKVYEIELLERARDYVVRARYGRRGSVLRSIDKWKGTNIYDAEDAYNTLIDEKQGEGYDENIQNTVINLGDLDVSQKLREVWARYTEDRELNDAQLLHDHGVGYEDRIKPPKASKPKKAKETPPDRNIVIGDL
jgi:predicted DNA-binding WGR domain protein